MQGVTPVPIPNTEVKPLQPMILLSGKVGYRRLYEPRQRNAGGARFIFGLWALARALVSAADAIEASVCRGATIAGASSIVGFGLRISGGTDLVNLPVNLLLLDLRS